MTGQTIRLRHQFAPRPENLEKLTECLQFAQSRREAIQPRVAVFFYKTVQASEPMAETLIQSMIEAYCQRPTASHRECQRHQKQGAGIPKRKAKA